MINKEKPKKSDFPNYNNYLVQSQKNIPIKKSSEQKNKKKSAPKNSNNLEKITGSGDINIAGSQPIVMFKKPVNKKVSKSPNPLNSKYTINKPKFEYVSDGGMSQKIQKYNSNTNLNPNNINNNKNLYYYNNYISEKDHSSHNNKNKKNNIEKNINTNKQKKQILSKTLKDFNKRPLMMNNKDNNKDKEKEIINKTKNSIDERKMRQKIINKNVIKNNKYYNKQTNEDSKEQEEEKLIRMKQLVQNGVVNEIKKLENKTKIKK